MNYAGVWRIGTATLLVLALWVAPAVEVPAQLVGCAQVAPTNAPGGCIERTLEDQIDLGHNSDIQIPGTNFGISTGSIFLIKHDPARSIRRGRQLFQRKFTENQGQGPRVNDDSTGSIVANRAFGAGLMDSCAGCHGRPRGSAGHGGVVQTFPDSRDSPHLFGLGLIEQLGDEMTTTLRAIRQQAIDDALGGGGPPQTLVDADFDNGTNGFAYQDDAFGTSNPFYASGNVVFLGSDGIIRVRLGNIDNADIFGMSGGWSHTFSVGSAVSSATLSLNYRLLQSSEYESDEFSEAKVLLDGNVVATLETFVGDGNGGFNKDTGEKFATIPLGSLSAGNHTLVLGGTNNKKTFNNEWTEIFYNNVVVETAGGCPVTRDLDTKGVNFGQITVACDGTVDYSAVEGVDTPSLRIRPFFAEGVTVSMREFIVGAMNAEMGIQINDPVLCAVTDPDNPVSATSPSGFAYDPSLDTFERPPVCDAPGELDPAALDHLEFYLLNYFKPGRYLETARSKAGLQLMHDIGCTTCHVQNLTVDSDRRVADVETNFDPIKGIFNELFAVATGRFHAEPDPDNPDFDFVLPNGDPFVVENVFTDLKRHDLGPDFDERDWEDGDDPTTRLQKHMTEPLWGVGSTAPYGHDGRSINLDAVIRRHGGEAADVTLAYASLSEDNQSKILEFLNTLVLFPPDDTASNLNEGNPGDPGFPQTGHGNIALGELFTIPSSDIGPE